MRRVWIGADASAAQHGAMASVGVQAMALHLEGIVRPSTVGVYARSGAPSGALTDRTDLDGVEARGRRVQHMRGGLDGSSVSSSNLNALATTVRNANARYPAYRTKQHASSTSPERRRRTMEDALRASVAEQAAAHAMTVSQGVQVAATLHTRFFFPTTEVRVLTHTHKHTHTFFTQQGRRMVSTALTSLVHSRTHAFAH